MTFNKNNISLISKTFNIKSNNIDSLVDANIYITGSFENPVLGGNLALNNGFIYFSSTNNNKKYNTKLNIFKRGLTKSPFS